MLPGPRQRLANDDDHGGLDTSGPAQADIGAANGRVPRDQVEAVAGLVDAEQRVTQRDLTDQALAVRRIIQMRAGAEQPVVECAGRLQVMGGEGDMVNSDYARHG